MEEFDQIDLSVGYEFNEHLSVSPEGINITGEDVRWHGRSEKQLWRLDDQSARYAWERVTSSSRRLTDSKQSVEFPVDFCKAAVLGGLFF